MNNRIFCEWESGAYISTLCSNFTEELNALIEQYGPPDKIEFRASDEGWTHWVPEN